LLRLSAGAPEDLRRRNARESAAQILNLADLLPAPDRLLLAQVLEEGRSVASLAALMGQKPASLRRRVKGLIARVRSTRYAIVRAHASQWPDRRARVARACVIEGRSMPQAARALGLTYHVVRTQMREIELLISTLDASRSGASTSSASGGGVLGGGAWGGGAWGGGA
jgi:DNA-directed RNA polymerase specialized sigma24 family protein